MVQRRFEGEWWILADGTSVYADSADGMSHEDVVMQEVFGAYRSPQTPEDQPDEDNWMDWGIPLSGPDKDALRDQGMPEDTIAFFSKRNADARDYGTQVLGWIRAKANAFNMREFDDDALRRIQRFDGWVDGAEVMDGTVDLYADAWEAQVPVRVLFKAESAAALKRYMAPDGVGRWRENPAPSPELRKLQAAYPGQVAYKVRSHGWLYPDGTVAELGPETHVASVRRVLNMHTPAEMWEFMRRTKTIRVSQTTDFEVLAVPTFAQLEFLREQTRRLPTTYVEAVAGAKTFYEHFRCGEEDQLDAWLARVYGDAHRENPYRNFHAARQTPKSAKRYVDYRWVNAAWHDGPDRPITVNYGVRHTWGPRQGRMEVHTVAFPAAIWTEAEARAWLKAHGLKDDHFEAATS